MEIRTKLITDLPLSEVLEGFEIFPVSQFGVAKKASTQDIISFTKKQNYATWVYKASTNLETVDLSSKYIKLYNSPQNDGSFPEFFIGEVGHHTTTGEISSLSGFQFHYNENTDRFVFVSYLSTNALNRSLTSYYIDSNAYMYITNLSTSNTLSARNIYVTDQITISANSNNDALYIVQSGQGNAIEVFDEINDITPFVVNASGNVGIKISNPIIDLTIQGNVSASQTLSARNIHVLDRVGIATSDPRETLTVSGSISARTIIYDGRSNSDRWFETFTNYSAGSANEARAVSFVNNNSSNISQVNSTVNNTSSNWNSVYSNWNSVSVLDLNVRSYVTSNSSNFSDSITRYNTASGTYATMAYTNRGFLPLSGGEVSSGVVRISGATTFGSDVTIVGRLCANLLTVLKTESIPITAATLSVQGSGSFGGAFNVGGEARFSDDLIVTGFANVSSTVTAEGIITSRQYLQDLNGTSRDWNSVYSNWNSVSVLDLNVRSFVVNNSTNSLNVNTTVNSTSSNWNSVYNTWNANSAFDLSARTFVNINSTNILNVNTTVNNNSANWNQAYTTWSPLSTITTGSTTFVSQNSVRSLNVNTYVTTTSGSIILNNGNAGPLLIGTNDNTSFTLETNSQSRMTINGGGNVGINTTNPNEQLTVFGNISSSNRITGNSIIALSNLGVGTNNPSSNLTVVVGTSSQFDVGNTIQFFKADDTPAGAGTLRLGKSRGTLTSTLSVQNEDTVGNISFFGHVGSPTTVTNLAVIRTSVDGTPSSTVIPSRITFHTRSLTDATTVERLRINNLGNVGINITNPNEILTVFGNISSNSIVYDGRGDSIRWNNAFTSVSPNSGNWNSAYSSFFNLSGAIGDGLTEFQESSARYNRVSTRMEVTSANWNSVYTTFQSNSAKYNSERGVINIALSGTSVITVPNHTVGFMDIYLNGIKLVKPDDFSETATTITLTEPTKYNNYKLEYVVYGAYNVANAVARTGDTMTGDLTVPNLNVTGSFTLPTMVLSRQNTTDEGGEIQFARASDGQSKYWIDTYGSGNNPDLRIFERTAITPPTFAVRAVIQGSTGNVGINSTNPDCRLHVYQNTAGQCAARIQSGPATTVDNLWVYNEGSGSAASITNTGAGAALWISQVGSGYSLVIADESIDGTPTVIDNAGNVGIGRVPETNVKLDIWGATSSPTPTPDIRLASTNGGGLLITNNTGQGFWNPLVQQNDKSIIYYGNAGLNAGGFTIGQYSDQNRGVRISPTGNVGISTGTPNQRLTVVGNISATGSITANGFVGDAAGLYNLDITKKFYKFPNQDNLANQARMNFFISEDRRLYVAGADNYGWPQAGINNDIGYTRLGFHSVEIPENEVLNVGEKIEDIFVNHTNKYILTNQGNLLSIGVNTYNQLGTGTADGDRAWWKKIALSNVRHFSCNNVISVNWWNSYKGAPWYGMYPWAYAVTTDGRVYAWGWSGGTNFASDVSVPTLITTGDIVNKNIVKVFTQSDQYNSSNSQITFAIDSNRDIYAKGNPGAMLGIDGVARTNFTRIPNMKADKVVANKWNNSGTTFIQDGTRLFSCGSNEYGQLGVATATTTRNNLVEISGLTPGVKDFHANGYHNGTVAVIRTDGKLMTWGRNNNGQLGRNGTTNDHIPRIPDGLSNINFKKVLIASGAWTSDDYSTTYALSESGDLYATGYNADGQCGRGPFPSDAASYNRFFRRMLFPSNDKIVDFYPHGWAGGTIVTVVTERGDLYSCGWNGSYSTGIAFEGTNNILHPRRCLIN